MFTLIEKIQNIKKLVKQQKEHYIAKIKNRFIETYYQIL